MQKVSVRETSCSSRLVGRSAIGHFDAHTSAVEDIARTDGCDVEMRGEVRKRVILSLVF